MSDWEKLKVTELKEELKARGVALTGLKLKQQLIDKLVEYESNSAKEENSVETATNGALEEVDKDQGQEVEAVEAQKPAATETPIIEKSEADAQEQTAHDDSQLPPERPAILKEEDSVAEETDLTNEPPVTQDTPVANTIEEAKEIKRNDVMIPQDGQVEMRDVDGVNEAASGSVPQEAKTLDADIPGAEEAREILEERLAQQEEPAKIVDTVTEASSKPVSADNPEEERKRKRRSATPVPTTEEIQKKAKGTDGEAIVTKTGGTSGQSSRSRSRSSERVAHDKQQQIPTKEHILQQGPSPEREHSPASSEGGDIEPATHPATRTLYIRNFKRPLHIPTLRSHLSSLAKARTTDVDDEHIKLFYLDPIRTHAFVSFSNIVAASRVRIAMHGTRFPDEPQREPLWVDFVPDEKVEGWIDQESGDGAGAFGRGASGRGKFEVVYQKDEEGSVRAVLQKISTTQQPLRTKSFSNGDSRSLSFSQQRNDSYSADASKTSAMASEVHPDRAAFVPRSPEADRRQASRSSQTQRNKPYPRERETREEDKTPAFHALSSLFSSTRTKPLLYFKLPPQPVIDERLDMFRDLFSDRGTSGEPGMKRYTFERVRGREEWVDNGPEFGHGKKGFDRLTGSARGGFRGGRGAPRGGSRGRFGGGDSYRGGGVR